MKRHRMDQAGQIQQKGTEIVEASYKVASLAAKNVQAYTTAESVVIPAVKILVRRTSPILSKIF